MTKKEKIINQLKELIQLTPEEECMSTKELKKLLADAKEKRNDRDSIPFTGDAISETKEEIVKAQKEKSPTIERDLTISEIHDSMRIIRAQMISKNPEERKEGEKNLNALAKVLEKQTKRVKL